MRRMAAWLATATLALAGCGRADPPPSAQDARERIDRAASSAREGGRKAVDRADEALDALERSDLPEDAQKQLREAKKLVDEQR